LQLRIDHHRLSIELQQRGALRAHPHFFGHQRLQPAGAVWLTSRTLPATSASSSNCGPMAYAFSGPLTMMQEASAASFRAFTSSGRAWLGLTPPPAPSGVPSRGARRTTLEPPSAHAGSSTDVAVTASRSGQARAMDHAAGHHGAALLHPHHPTPHPQQATSTPLNASGHSWWQSWLPLPGVGRSPSSNVAAGASGAAAVAVLDTEVSLVGPKLDALFRSDHLPTAQGGRRHATHVSRAVRSIMSSVPR
jgi:hypothetical protein